jgi:hypothetical protein
MRNVKLGQMISLPFSLSICRLLFGRRGGLQGADRAEENRTADANRESAPSSKEKYTKFSAPIDWLGDAMPESRCHQEKLDSLWAICSE